MKKIIKNKFRQFLVVISLFAWGCAGSEAPATTQETGIPAIDQLSQQIAKEPNKVDLYAARSKAYTDNELYPQAVADAERVLQLDSINAQSYRLLSNAYFDNNQSLPAIETLQKALQKFPKETYFYLMAAEMQLIVEQYKDALISVDKLLKEEPYNAEALFMRGQVLKYMGDTLQAMVYYQKAVEQDADHINAYLQLGIMSGEMGMEISLQYLDNALRIDSTDMTAWMKKAFYFYSKRRYDEALTCYEKAIIFHPQEPDPPYNLGLMYLDKGDESIKSNPAAAQESYKQAQHYFSNATQFDPTFGEAYYYRGLAEEKMGNPEAALRDYDQALVFEQVIQGIPISWIQDGILRVRKK